MHKSEHIKKRKAQMLLNSFNFARYLETPINHFIVINLVSTSHQHSTTAFRKIINKYSRWLEYKRRKGITNCIPTYVFTHENPTGNNPHVNIGIHVPDELKIEFERKLNNWIATTQGELTDCTLSCRDIDNGKDMNVAYYMIKGVEPEYLDYFKIPQQHQEKGPQGTIYGTRAGFSRSLGPVAMKAAKFNPMKYYRKKKREFIHKQSLLP